MKVLAALSNLFMARHELQCKKCLVGWYAHLGQETPQMNERFSLQIGKIGLIYAQLTIIVLIRSKSRQSALPERSLSAASRGVV